MTTPPNYQQAYPKRGIPFGTETDAHIGICMGRARMQELSQGFLGTFCITPVCVPWTLTTDQNGQAYPAGLVGVRQTYSPQHDSDYTNSRFDIIPVPSVLPTGYTANPLRYHNVRPGSSDSAHGQGYFNSGFQTLPPTHATNQVHRIRLSGGGIHTYYYLPESQGASATADDSYNSNVGSSAWSTYPSAGLRYIQWKGVWPGITVELRCNANNSNSGIGDTVLATYTAGGVKSDSPVFTAGLSFALGVRKYLYFRINPAPPDIINLLAGPRCDLPLSWTVTGQGLIAPGGYVASALDQPLP